MTRTAHARCCPEAFCHVVIVQEVLLLAVALRRGLRLHQPRLAPRHPPQVSPEVARVMHDCHCSLLPCAII